MRILTISNCPLVESEGSGYVVVNFCEGLRRLGHEVDAFGPPDFEMLPYLKGRARSYRLALGWVKLVFAQLRKKKYDVLEFYGGQSWLACMLLPPRNKRDFLIVAHTNGPETLYEDAMRQHFGLGHRRWFQLDQAPLMKRAFTNVDGVVTVSEFAKNWCECAGYRPPFGIIHIENSLPLFYLRRSSVARRTFTIGFCGNWLPVKGIDTIRADITRVLSEFPEARFKVIGANDFKLTEFPLNVRAQIEVVPRVADKSRLPAIYETLDILIMPSVIESFGLVAAEAMACGCAVVATKVGIAAGLTHREDAMLMDRSASPLLYQAVRELLLDDQLRWKIATKGQQRVQNLRWETAVQMLEKTYSDWLNQNRSCRAHDRSRIAPQTSPVS